MKILLDAWNDLKAQASGMLAPLRGRYEGLLAQMKDFSASNRRLAEYHMEHENFGDAALRFRLLVWQRPKDGDAWAGLAASLVLNGEPEKARRPLKMALKLQPDHPRAKIARAYFEALKKA